MSCLCKTNFPLYRCQCVDEKVFFVSGGGGAAKTGVRNCVQIFEINKTKKKPSATPLHEHETGKHAVMQMSAQKIRTGNEHSVRVALGMGSECNIYSVSSTVKTSDDSKSNSTVRRRKESEGKKKTVEKEFGLPNYSFASLASLSTSTKADITAVQLSRDGSLVSVGISKGHLKTWKLVGSEYKLLFSVHGHKDDITDVDISPDMEKIVTASRDCKAYVWDSSNGDKLLDLSSLWNSRKVTRSYRFRNCRFAVIPEQPSKHNLFTSHCPSKQGPNNICCVTKWARRRNKEGVFVSDLIPAIIQGTGKEHISSMAVSPNGVFLGLGFMDGSVAIYIAFSLHCAKRVRDVHSIFVTSLSFLHDSPNLQELQNEADAALVSVSADCTCKLTKLDSRSMFPIWMLVIICIIVIIGSALYLHSVGIV